jgi:TusA-related sulfurtransferase
VSAPPPPVVHLDLRGVGCPLNYVKTRVALDRVAPGECVEVWVDHGEPAENVPRSCEEDGFPVLLQEATDTAGSGYLRLVVQRPIGL